MRNKFGYLFMPPGWNPVSHDKTAKSVRQEYLRGREHLGYTSRRFVFEK